MTERSEGVVGLTAGLDAFCTGILRHADDELREMASADLERFWFFRWDGCRWLFRGQCRWSWSFVSRSPLVRLIRVSRHVVPCTLVDSSGTHAPAAH